MTRTSEFDHDFYNYISMITPYYN